MATVVCVDCPDGVRGGFTRGVRILVCGSLTNGNRASRYRLGASVLTSKVVPTTTYTGQSFLQFVTQEEYYSGSSSRTRSLQERYIRLGCWTSLSLVSPNLQRCLM